MNTPTAEATALTAFGIRAGGLARATAGRITHNPRLIAEGHAIVESAHATLDRVAAENPGGVILYADEVEAVTLAGAREGLRQ